MMAKGIKPDSSKSSSHSSSASSAAVDWISGEALMVEPPALPIDWVCSLTVAFGRGFAAPGAARGVVCLPIAGPAGAGAFAKGIVFAPIGGALGAGANP